MVRQTFEIYCVRVSPQRPWDVLQMRTILLMKRSSSCSRSRSGLYDVSLRGGPYMLKNAPGLRTENA